MCESLKSSPGVHKSIIEGPSFQNLFDNIEWTLTLMNSLQFNDCRVLQLPKNLNLFSYIFSKEVIFRK